MLGMIARPFIASAIGTGTTAAYYLAAFPQSNLGLNDYGRTAKLSFAVNNGTTIRLLEIDLGANPPGVDAVAVLWHNLSSLNTFTVNANNAGFGSGATYTSGALPAVTGTSARDVKALGKFLVTLSAVQTFRYWWVDYQNLSGAVETPQLSRAVLMRKSIFAIGPQRAELSAIDYNQKIQLENGEDRSSEDSLLIKPVVQLDLNYAKQSEMEQVLGQYVLGLGSSLPMMVVPDLTSGALQDMIVFGRAEQIISLQSDTYDVWKFAARVRSFGP
jgi:hypothetical protein